MTKKEISKDLIRVVSPFRKSFLVRDKKKQEFWKTLSAIPYHVNINILPVKVKVIN